MYQRSIKSSGGSDHVELVKLATKRIIDEFDEVTEVVINYEAELDVNIQFGERHGYGRTSTSFNFRPDILVTTTKYMLDEDIDTEKRKIWQAHRVFFEIETKPRRLFRNTLKIECYRKMRRGRIHECAFVLVCWDDAKLPKNTAPFEEVWTFARSQGEEGESR